MQEPLTPSSASILRTLFSNRPHFKSLQSLLEQLPSVQFLFISLLQSIILLSSMFSFVLYALLKSRVKRLKVDQSCFHGRILSFQLRNLS